MPGEPSTAFLGRLRARDPAAWFELWETFGPLLRAQLARWGRGSIGPETVQDLSQETLAALSGAMERHDPGRGARFSSWLLAIARHLLGDEMDRRRALKRGGGRKPLGLDGLGEPAGPLGEPDAAFEQAVFDAKVVAALRHAQRDCGFEDFVVWRMRILESRSGRAVAEALGVSEPTVSRRLSRVRERLRARLVEVFARYGLTEDERRELSRKGLDRFPNKGDEAAFDEAVAEIVHRHVGRREAEGARAEGTPVP